MKEKNNEEIKVEKVIEKKCFFTQDRVISFTLGLLIGILMTSCVFCIYKNYTYPSRNNQTIRMQQKRQMIRHKKNSKKDTQEAKENNTTENSTNDTTKSN